MGLCRSRLCSWVMRGRGACTAGGILCSEALNMHLYTQRVGNSVRQQCNMPGFVNAGDEGAGRVANG